jgi:hypothetical protein
MQFFAVIHGFLSEHREDDGSMAGHRVRADRVGPTCPESQSVC